MRKHGSIQGRDDQGACVRDIVTHWSVERQAAPPICRSLRVDTAENYAALSRGPFDDCGGSVRILADHITPSRKLRAIFPIVIERRSLRHRDPHRGLAYTPFRGGVEAEFYT